MRYALVGGLAAQQNDGTMPSDPKLPDLLRPGLDLVICGTAASAESARRVQYYAGPGNRFWTVLYETGLTDRLLDPSEFRLLPDFGIGLTDIVKDQDGMDSEIEFKAAGTLLKDRLEPYAPRYLCFNGKRAAKEALAMRKVAYGLQEKSFGTTRLFVAPSTSGAARKSWDAGVWEELARSVRAK
jgi:TDG/mug DNA glycosylase family protein